MIVLFYTQCSSPLTLAFIHFSSLIVTTLMLESAHHDNKNEIQHTTGKKVIQKIKFCTKVLLFTTIELSQDKQDQFLQGKASAVQSQMNETSHSSFCKAKLPPFNLRWMKIKAGALVQGVTKGQQHLCQVICGCLFCYHCPFFCSYLLFSLPP